MNSNFPNHELHEPPNKNRNPEWNGHPVRGAATEIHFMLNLFFFGFIRVIRGSIAFGRAVTNMERL